MRLKLLLSAAILLCCNWMGATVYAQTISTSASSFSSLSGEAGITFVVQNANSTSVLLDDLSSYRTTASNGATYKLWYSSTSITGTSTIAGPTWTQIATATPSNVTASGVSAIFSGLGFTIPANTTYRFALVSSGQIDYGTAGTNTATLGGISVFTGSYAISGTNVGYSGSGGSLSITPRFFNGTLVFLSSACTNPPTPGNAVAGSSSVCATAPVQLGLSGNTRGIGQSYQWQRSTTATGTFTDIGSSLSGSATSVNPTATYFYRAALTCGTSTAYSAPVQVTAIPGLAAGIYTLNPSAPASATNFTTISSVASALTCGIAGPVTINIASGIYTGQLYIPQLLGASTTNRLTIQSATGNPADVIIQDSSTASTTNYVVRLDGASFVTFKNITIRNRGASNARCIEFASGASNDSIINCVITGPVTTSTGTAYARVYSASNTGSNNVIMNNTIQNGSNGIYVTSNSTAVPGGWVIQGNTISAYSENGIYTTYLNDIKILNNIISGSATATSYGIYNANSPNAVEIRNNKINVISTGGTKYGIYSVSSEGTATAQGLISNNAVSINNGTSTSTVYGIGISGGKYGRIYNNSVYVNSASATAGYAAYMSLTTSNTNYDVKNNIFANAGSGFALFITNPFLANSLSMDYNNLYTAGSKLIDKADPPTTGAPAGDSTAYTDLRAWRAILGFDKNSISHDPGFTSSSNLMPSASNAASWSVNGRGIHIDGNDKDINGNTRVTARAAGVPDLGAYEFTPTATPPAATAIPATPTAGSMQYFLFGQDTVATIDWSASGTLPTSLTVRQYTGTIPPQLLATSPSSYMYFYTELSTPAGNYEYTPNIYYKKPWLGTIANENDLKMIRKLGSSVWYAYNFTASSANTIRNILTAPGMANTGFFSGIDNDIIFLAVINPGKTIFCPGGSVQLTANVGAGITYKWMLNGAYIPGATSSNYTATVVGDYAVEETRNSAIAVSEPVSVTSINPPIATITTAGNPVICTGGSIVLNGNTGTQLTYQWKRNGIDIPSAINTNFTVSSAGNYTLEVTNPGCSTVSVPMAVTSLPLPMAVISPDTNVVLCPGDAITMSALLPATPINDINYQWRMNGNDIPGATGTTFSTAAAGNYTVVVSSSTCPVTLSAGTNINTTQAPTPVITSKGFTLSTGAYSSYQWYKDGMPIADATSFNYTAKENGVYSVSVSNGGCDGMSQDFVITTVGVKDVNGNSAISVYPNPAMDRVYINTPYNVNVTLTGADGRVALQEKAIKTFSIGNIPDGLYILKVTNEQNQVIATEKLIKSSK